MEIQAKRRRAIPKTREIVKMAKLIIGEFWKRLAVDGIAAPDVWLILFGLQEAFEGSLGWDLKEKRGTRAVAPRYDVSSVEIVCATEKDSIAALWNADVGDNIRGAGCKRTCM
jgi:hypothetical protein